MKLLRKRDVPDEKYTNAFLGFGPENTNFAVELTNFAEVSRPTCVAPLPGSVLTVPPSQPPSFCQESSNVNLFHVQSSPSIDLFTTVLFPVQSSISPRSVCHHACLCALPSSRCVGLGNSYPARRFLPPDSVAACGVCEV